MRKKFKIIFIVLFILIAYVVVTFFSLWVYYRYGYYKYKHGIYNDPEIKKHYSLFDSLFGISDNKKLKK